MIHKAEYVRELIRKQEGGSLTAIESALLRAAQRIYDEREWQRMVKEAAMQPGTELPDDSLQGWEPDFAGIVETARRRKRMARMIATGIRYGMVAAAILVVFIGFRLYHRITAPLQVTGICADMPRNIDIAVSEFAATIRYGDSVSIPVAAGTQGRIAQVGNLEIRRDASGVFVLKAMREATVGYPSIRFITAPFQQAEVLLPDGARVRLNAESVLTYPLLVSEADISYARISGEAVVTMPERQTVERSIVETANCQVQTTSGKFAILASAAETRITLLAGGLSVITKQDGHQRVLERPGSQAYVKWTHELYGSVTESLFYRKRTNVEMVTGWTKAVRRYRDASLREFVADMSRWYGIRVKDIHCIPESMRVNALVCYRASLNEALAIVNKAGLRVHRSNGMFSFCDSDDGFKPAMAGVDHGRRACDYCGRLR